jgi:hypothetical protein
VTDADVAELERKAIQATRLSRLSEVFLVMLLVVNIVIVVALAVAFVQLRQQSVDTCSAAKANREKNIQLATIAIGPQPTSGPGVTPDLAALRAAANIGRAKALATYLAHYPSPTC